MRFTMTLAYAGKFKVNKTQGRKRAYTRTFLHPRGFPQTDALKFKAQKKFGKEGSLRLDYRGYHLN